MQVGLAGFSRLKKLKKPALKMNIEINNKKIFDEILEQAEWDDNR